MHGKDFLKFVVGLVGCLVFGSGVVRAQGSVQFIESRLSHGFIIIHSTDIEAVRNSYPWGFEVDMGWQKNTEEAWNRCAPKTSATTSISVTDSSTCSTTSGGRVFR